jgi:pimeloyl-ACP methyl ester carboxylesterase
VFSKGTMKVRLRALLLGFGIVALLVVGIVLLPFVRFRASTPPIEGPQSIASLEKFRIGGIEQWVLIRGHDRTKPLLLFLHGGPGMPVMFLAHACQRKLERDFVVVNWDRRGSGKSFDSRAPGSALTVSQTLEDTYDLTRQLRARFGQETIYLVGHSWGSYLGLLAVRGHPDYYRAFIGMGQMAGNREEVRALRHSLLTRVAKEAGESKLLSGMADKNAEITEDDLFRAGGELHASRSFWPILLTGLRAPEYTFRDALNVKKGADLVGRDMKYDVLPKPLEGEIPKFDVPIFFFLGRHDFNTPSQLAAEYLDRIQAPLKQVVWFEESAHFPFFEETDYFHKVLTETESAISVFWKAQTNSPLGSPGAR